GGDGASRMRTDSGIGHDAIGRVRTRGIVEFGRIELDDDDIVQTRTAADHRGLGIFWPGMLRRPAKLQIRWLDDLPRLRPLGEDKEIAGLRTFTAARLAFLGAGRADGKAGSRNKRRCE